MNLATYDDDYCQSDTYMMVVQGTIGKCAKDGNGAQTTFISTDTALSPTAAPTVFLDGYAASSYYRSDRGVILCNTFVSATTEKLNACRAITHLSWSHNSIMVVATATHIFTRRYTDSKCQNLLKTAVIVYTAGLCVESSDRTSMIRSVTAKISTDLTAPRVTLA